MLCIQYGSMELEPVISAMCGVEERYMRKTCAWMKERYGSVMGYLQGAVGVREEEIARLRELYLE